MRHAQRERQRHPWTSLVVGDRLVTWRLCAVSRVKIVIMEKLQWAQIDVEEKSTTPWEKSWWMQLLKDGAEPRQGYAIVVVGTAVKLA